MSNVLNIFKKEETPKNLSAAEKFATSANNNESIRGLLECSGLDWSVALKELKTPEGIIVPNKAVIRQDNNEVLGVVGKNYTPVQNATAFGFFDDFLSSGRVKLANAGMIAGGKKVFVQAEILNSESQVIGEDTVTNYLTIAKAHDGTMSLNVGMTPIRMFCANQIATVVRKAEGKMLKFKHSPKIHENLDQVAAVLAQTNQDFAKTLEAYRHLATKEIRDGAELEHYLKTVLIGQNYVEVELDGKKPCSRIIENVFSLFESGRGAKQTANTYWKAYNALNEYLNHEKGDDVQKRFDALNFGVSRQIDNRALGVALKFAS